MAKLTKSIIIRVSPEELANLEALAKARRHRTGEPTTRVDLLREGVRLLVEREALQHQAPPAAKLTQEERDYLATVQATPALQPRQAPPRPAQAPQPNQAPAHPAPAKPPAPPPTPARQVDVTPRFRQLKRDRAPL